MASGGAAAGLALAWLARSFSSPALPDPGPLPASVPIPDAEPPEDMELIAVPTWVNNRVAAYAYRGGSAFDRRDFYIGAALIKHPRGDLLVDAGYLRTSGTPVPRASAPRSPRPRLTGRSSTSRADRTWASPAATTSMATGRSSAYPHPRLQAGSAGARTD